jgi:SLAP domain-containing protein
MDTWIGSLPAGDYYYGVTFSEDTKYLIEIEQYSYVLTPKLSQTTATITKGFTKKLSVTNGTVKKWSSGNSKIAKVSAKGKVTGVKTGATTITATLNDGTKLKCNVTVKANKYSATKQTTGDVPSGKWYYQSYSAAYDAKGNLVVKVRVINNSDKNICEFRNIAVTVKNANGKTIGTYSQNTKSVSIESGSSKDFTFTIKKSALKTNKTQDLRNAGITVTMNGYYYTYR